METSNKSHVWYCQTTSNSCASLHIQAEGAQAKPATSLMSHAVKPLATHALLYTSRLKDHKLNFNWVFSPGVLIALDYLAMIGTSDRPCWLAESYRILLLLLLTPAEESCLVSTFQHMLSVETQKAFSYMSCKAQERRRACDTLRCMPNGAVSSDCVASQLGFKFFCCP